jgi:signal peptidase
MAEMRALRLGHVLLLLTLAGLLAWFVLLGPVVLGGPATYVWVSGVSMEPTLESGDLAIVRQAGAYRLGDVVAFRVPDGDPGAGGIVIHRIVGGSAAAGFVVRGDNKGTPDSWRPTDEDVVGKLWFTIPGGARHLGLIRDPALFGSAAAGLTVFLVLAGRGRRPKNGPEQEPLPAQPVPLGVEGGHLPRAWASPAPTPGGSRREWRHSLGLGVVLGLVLASVGGAAAALEVEGGTVQVFTLPVSIDAEPTSAIVDIKPEALHLGNEGEVVTAFIELPDDDAFDIDVSSVRLCVGFGDCGRDGVAATDPQWPPGQPQLKVQFSRGEVIALLAGIEAPAEVTLTVSGLVGTRTFVGSDVVGVVGPSADDLPMPTPSELQTPEPDPSATESPAPEPEYPSPAASSSPPPSPSNEPSETPSPPTETSSPEPAPVELPPPTIESTSPEPVTSPEQTPTVSPDVSPGPLDATSDLSVCPSESPIPEVSPRESRLPVAESCGQPPADPTTASPSPGLDLTPPPATDPASPSVSPAGAASDWAVVGAIPFLVILELRRRTRRHRHARRHRPLR